MSAYLPLPELLQRYTATGQETIFADRFNELLQHPDAYQRSHLPGHITGSAWVVNETRTSVLLVHHAKLNRWLQPGGHADGDKDILAVALRELQEETGIQHVQPLVSGIFDIDIHPIPARKDFPQHDHYDVRFAFVASGQESIQVSEESFDVQWVSLDSISTYTDSQSILRMVYKTRQLLRH